MMLHKWESVRKNDKKMDRRRMLGYIVVILFMSILVGIALDVKRPQNTRMTMKRPEWIGTTWSL